MFLFKHTRFSIPKLRRSFFFILLLSASAERDFFVQDHVKKKGYQPTPQALNNHLIWIKRFYFGWSLAPTGWLKMTERLVTSLAPDIDTQKIEGTLYTLGKEISAEWAQENGVRHINTAHISIWGNALKKSVKLNRQVEILEKIEYDVYALLAGKIHPKVINSERYLAADDYNDF